MLTKISFEKIPNGYFNSTQKALCSIKLLQAKRPSADLAIKLENLTNSNSPIRLYLLVKLQIKVNSVPVSLPLTVFLGKNFPSIPPLCNVMSTKYLKLKPNHMNMDNLGLVYHEFLSNWKENDSLDNLFCVLEETFTKDNPVDMLSPAEPVKVDIKSIPSKNVDQITLDLREKIFEKTGNFSNVYSKAIDEMAFCKQKLTESSIKIDQQLRILEDSKMQLDGKIKHIENLLSNCSEIEKLDGKLITVNDALKPDSFIDDILLRRIVEERAATDTINFLKSAIFSGAAPLNNVLQEMSKQYLIQYQSRKVITAVFCRKQKGN